MKGMFKMKKRSKIISVFLALLMVAGVFSGLAVSSSAASENVQTSDNPYGLLDNVEGGLILHCWCWSFNSIKENMENIAKAGYTAVQTSPINEVYQGDGGGLAINGDNADGKWYYHYQPTAYTIGNYQLGTEDEFKAMCKEAHNYGVKVIVDVVANHTTSSNSAVSSSLRNIEGGLYHNYNGAQDKASRKSVTQWYSGMPDTNTQNPAFQSVILNYLKQCIADGADGFRYDTAKHIELPDDDAEFAGNFWPTVLENGSSFQYGEVLQGGSSAERTSTRFADYAKIMHVTASSYGGVLRSYLKSYSNSANTLSNYSSEGVSEDRLVTWVESHDTYANGGSENSSTSFWLTNDQIRRGWAILASRGSTSLFFSRPDGSSVNNIWGNNKIGPAGDDNYFNAEVSAVNHFHNAMNGETSSMKNLGNKKYVMISRGTKGAVIVNNNTSDLTVNHATDLITGKYTDLSHGSTFTVKDGILTGTVKAGEIVVLNNTDSTHYSPDITEPATTAPPKTTVKLVKYPKTLYVKASSKISVKVTNQNGATSFKSSNGKIAKVDSKGKVTALKKGTAKITVTNNKVSTSFKITVKNPKLNKNSVTLKKGKTFKIKVTGKVGSQKYSSSNKKVASVSSKGKVKAKKAGKAKITVKTNGIKLKLNVKVKKSKK